MDPSLIVLGGVGGVIPEAIRIIKGMHDPAVPAYLRTVNFFLGLILLIALGCFAAWLAHATDAKQALAFGYGAPELITRLLSSSGQNRADGVPSVTEWWSR